MTEIERELEATLHRVLDPIAARPIPPRRSPAGRGSFRTVAGGAGAALALKVAGAGVAFAAAVSVTGASVTGSINPMDWGQQVSTTVQTCKDSLSAGGAHGIGPCVSKIANQHGKAVSSAAQHQGSSNGSGNGHGNTNGTNNGHGAGNGGGNGNSNASGNTHSKGTTKSPPPKS